MVLLSLVWIACGSSERPGRAAGVQDAATPADAGESDAQIELPAECNAEAPTQCPDPMPHYPDVAPIFARRCSGCHNGMDGHWPLSTYQHVADWYGEIRAQMLACTMPPPTAGIAMPLDERKQILSWIRCGFPK
jgi:hypothetical protein